MGKRLFIQFYDTDKGNSLTLPVNPESIDIATEKEVETHKILDYGEVPVSGYKKLKTISLKSLLPADTSYFALLSSLVEELKHKMYTKEKSVRMLENWVEAGKPIRVIIAGDAYDEINAEFLIQKFNKNIREVTPDITGTIDLIEYRKPNYTPEKFETRRETYGKEIANKLVKLVPRPINKLITSNIVARQGATLYKIAKKTYGEASASSKLLAEINGILDRNKDVAGEIIEMRPIEEVKNLNNTIKQRLNEPEVL